MTDKKKIRILYVVIAAKDVPLEIQNANEVAHVCPRQLKEGVEALGYEADYFPIAGTVSRWNYLKGAVKFFWMSLRGDLDKYDIIHAHYGFHGVVARCQFRKPLVLSLMGSDVYRRSERMIARVLVKLVDAVIVPGRQMLALVDNYPGDVIPYGTDLDLFVPMNNMMELREKLGLPKDKKLVLFPYNPTRVYHKRPDVIEAAVKQIDGAEMIVAYGKPSSQVAEYMNACDVLAMASSYEGSPGTIREALACNMPIVSVDVADVKDHITGVEGCYLCEREPNDMAAKLRLAFADNKRLPHGREKVLNLGLKECAQRTIELYERVLQKRGENVTKPLRIGMVVHAYYLRDARVIRYGEALAQAGHEVTVICLQDPDDAPYEKVNGVDIYRVRFERRRGGKLWYILEYVWAFVLFIIKLTQLEMKQHFDVIHVHNMPDFLIFTGFVPRLRGAKLILDLHDPMPELFMSKYDLERGTIIRILEIEERISCWYADALITVDQSFKDIFIRRHVRGDKITIVRNMPDDSLFAISESVADIHPPKDRFVLIFAGTIAERYRIVDVIRAVKKAQAQVPNILLRLVGKLDKEGAYTQELQALTKELQLENAVEFHPPVPLVEVPKLYRQAHLGLEPSRHDPYTDYVLPLKLLECVALGVPCLVSRRPTIENYFTDEDVAYFEPGDIDGMAAHIIELAQSPEKLEKLAANSRRVLERYNWPQEKASYFGLLTSLTEKK